MALDVVLALRAAGHDIVWASDLEPRRPDEGWLELAEQDVRLLLTNDKDFGDLVFRDRKHSTVGVILLRIGGMTPHRQSEVLRALFEADFAWHGNFSVLTETLLRQARLPDLKPTL